ncbi:MAG TPA: hypothetical protein PKM27_09540 [Saprospiraceae bacterium]|nr:hypothetical protein [Saprospiraceae bacterium]HNT21440.1 hypothetical protein [Saprospiraceae bacterium]
MKGKIWNIAKAMGTGLLACMLAAGMVSCNEQPTPAGDVLELSMVYAGDNRPELEKVIDHFSRIAADSLKKKSAIFLITNMKHKVHYGGRWIEKQDSIFSRAGEMDREGILQWLDSFRRHTPPSVKADLRMKHDLQHLSADYLIQNIEQAHEAWENAPWKDLVSYDAFCHFILPYNSLTEYPESWRAWLKEKYGDFVLRREDLKTMEDYCCAFVEEEKSWFRYSEVFFDYPSTLRISDIFKAKQGACVEMANLAAYSARAWGIPVALDFTPQWANHTTGHTWNALITSDSSFIPFLGAEGAPGDFNGVSTGETKTARIYRLMQAEVETSFARAAKIRGIEALPPYLKNPRILDVTGSYVPTASCSIAVRGKEGTPVYLCIFKQGQWNAVAGGFIEDDKVLFVNMGRDIVYMPMFYQNNDYRQAAPPLHVDETGVFRHLVADRKEPTILRLERKYPLKKFRTKWTYAQYLIHARFEGSDEPEFKNPYLIYKAPEPYTWFATNTIGGKPARDRLEYHMLWEGTRLNPIKKYRYVRMVANEGNAFKLGELEFYSPDDSLPLKGKSIGTVPHPERAFDGLPGYSIIKEDAVDTERWVGLDLGESKPIAQIRYLPANDQNQVQPGKQYQLYYWKEKWISLGIQKAETHCIHFKAPPGAVLFWLHCADCSSTEERPFTYEKNRQVWW